MAQSIGLCGKEYFKKDSLIKKCPSDFSSLSCLPVQTRFHSVFIVPGKGLEGEGSLPVTGFMFLKPEP